MDDDPYSFQDNMLYCTFSPDPFAFMTSDDTTHSPRSSGTVSASANDQRFLMRRGFIEYSNASRLRDSTTCSSGHRNIHRRMIEYLRSIPSTPKPEMKKVDINNGGRLFRHMMRERLRREKMSQSYADLYSMLLPRSKADKKSIVQSATVHIKELNKVKEEVHMRNIELRERIEMMMMMDRQDKINNHVVRPAEAELAEAGTKIIGVRLMNPASTLDSMIGALQCVKGMGAMATTIHSDFSAEQFTAVMTIQTKIERSEVQKAVEKTLMETERKLRLQLLGSGGWAHQHLEQDQHNVEN